MHVFYYYHHHHLFIFRNVVVSWIDINECEDGSHNCDRDANCTNTAGSFICTCNPGLVGNGRSCTGIMILISIDHK